MTTLETTAQRTYYRIRWTVQEENGPHSFHSNSWYGSKEHAQTVINAQWGDFVLKADIEEVPDEILP